MDEQTPQQQNPAPQTTTPSEGGVVGPLIGAIIVIALLVFGGLYFWGTQLGNDSDALPLITDGESGAPVNDNSDLSNSDTTAALEADADAAYMAQMEADLNADMQALENDLNNL